MRIIVVGDSKAMRMIVMRTLRQAGFQGHAILEAENGVQAHQLINADPPDLVLCDWNMPEMNGLDLLMKLNSEGKKMKFGFVTSEVNPEMRDKAMSNGALFLVGKPFTAEAFQTIMQPLLAT